MIARNHAAKRPALKPPQRRSNLTEVIRTQHALGESVEALAARFRVTIKVVRAALERP